MVLPNDLFPTVEQIPPNNGFLDEQENNPHNGQVTTTNPLLTVNLGETKPTDQNGTADPFDSSPPDDEKVREIITFLDSHWWIKETYPRPQELMLRFNVFLPDLIELQERINKGLSARGLPPVEFRRPEKVRKDDLEFPEGFIAACNIVCDTADKRAIAKKLQPVGVTTRQWQAWLAVPKYCEYYQMRVNKAFKGTTDAAKLALTRNVEAGDLQSIKYYMELANVYRPNQQTLLNLGVLLGRLMEILPKFLTQDQLVQVADEFEQVLAIEITGKEQDASTP